MKWIKCEDRLPKIWEHVLVYGTEYKPGEGYRVEDKSWGGQWWRYISDDDGNSHELKDEEITHWMPLPKPPY